MSKSGQIFGNLFGAIKNIGAIAAPFGRMPLDMLTQVTARWKEWTQQPENMERIRAFFERSVPLVAALAGLLGDVQTFFRIAEKVQQIRGEGSFEGLIAQVRDRLLAAFERFAVAVSAGLVPAIVEFATRFLNLMATFSNHTGTITVTLNVSNGFLGVINFIIDKVPGASHILGILRDDGAHEGHSVHRHDHGPARRHRRHRRLPQV